MDSALFAEARKCHRSQLAIRLTLVSDELRAWHGIFWSERFALEIREELETAYGGKWRLRSIHYDTIAYFPVFGEWFGRLPGDYISLNFLRHHHPSQLVRSERENSVMELFVDSLSELVA